MPATDLGFRWRIRVPIGCSGGIYFPLSQVSPLVLEASSQWDEDYHTALPPYRPTARRYRLTRLSHLQLLAELETVAVISYRKSFSVKSGGDYLSVRRCKPEGGLFHEFEGP